MSAIEYKLCLLAYRILDRHVDGWLYGEEGWRAWRPVERLDELVVDTAHSLEIRLWGTEDCRDAEVR